MRWHASPFASVIVFFHITHVHRKMKSPDFWLVFLSFLSFFSFDIIIRSNPCIRSSVVIIIIFIYWNLAISDPKQSYAKLCAHFRRLELRVCVCVMRSRHSTFKWLFAFHFIETILDYWREFEIRIFRMLSMIRFATHKCELRMPLDDGVWHRSLTFVATGSLVIAFWWCRAIPCERGAREHISKQFRTRFGILMEMVNDDFDRKERERDRQRSPDMLANECWVFSLVGVELKTHRRARTHIGVVL